MINDPYQVLGLPHTATDEEVTKAYRALAKKYHPDLHPNDPAAAEKMSEINAAYDMIKEGWKPGQSAPSGGGSAGYSGTGRPQPGYDPFEEFFRRYASGGYWQRETAYSSDEERMNAARLYINARQYRAAIETLAEVTARSARWFYLSAVANYGAGNRITALEHARIAHEAEPGNAEYERLYLRMQGIAEDYSAESASYGRPSGAIPRYCLRLCLANIILNAVLGLFCYGGQGGFCC